MLLSYDSRFLQADRTVTRNMLIFTQSPGSKKSNAFADAITIYSLQFLYVPKTPEFRFNEYTDNNVRPMKQ